MAGELRLRKDLAVKHNDNMKILQTISGMSAKSGGPSTCTLDMMNGLYDIHACTDLLTVKCAYPEEHNLGEGSPWLHEVENDCKTPFVISKNVQRFLKSSDYDLYHANALWMGMNHDTCRIARELGKPYIISPHGMLYPTALKVHAWKKWILLNLWYNKDIHSACCLHVTCMQEMEHCRSFGYKGPIAVIPNAVVFPKGIEVKQQSERNDDGKRVIGFLGRLHPIKKVERILYALDLLCKEDRGLAQRIIIQIMGKYDDAYEQWLKEEVKRLGLEESVEFVGFVSGKDKYERLAQLSALMVPSAQENFGMIVPEALICGTPVYASLGTPWNELNERHCGWWRDNEPATIANVIKEILSLSNDELLEMGRNGRKLMEEKYEQHKVASMMKRLYEWIVIDKMEKDKRPEFVYDCC